MNKVAPSLLFELGMRAQSGYLFVTNLLNHLVQ